MMDFKTKTMENINDLMTPIFALYNFESIEDIILKEDDSEYLKNFYNLGERHQLYSALQWAEKNPGYDFKSIMKDAPTPGKLKFSNKEIYNYLISFKTFMENKDFELLTDNRPTQKPWGNN